MEQSLSLNAQIKEEVYDFDAPICLDSSVLENHPSKEYSNPPVAVDGDDEIIAQQVTMVTMQTVALEMG